MRRNYKRRADCKLNFRTKLIIFLIVLIGVLFILDLKIRPVIKDATADRARAVAIYAINNAVNKELCKSDIKYNDIIHIERTENNTITGIVTDIQKINSLKANISTEILKEISILGMRKTEIPLGALLGIEFFSGSGPIIPIKIFILGNVTTDFESEFTEAGINQTKHRIYVNVKVNINAITPGYPTAVSVKTNITIAETIIVGSVPNVYATSSDSSEKARELKGLEGLQK
ncbi:MAG: sporulation protein YunB [Candidatus Improbicoccus pseudotrichonymphae]|uniref:Sporulation protein YunB n=1 Tax=Candidatus Improbicoccus pseudotrichonymphae TaxID=3033792 RepID=A0AA48KVG7_9FIRM|nr:MAG: sporulation protein YunB [Candidatus Improbicoccus pseudotrichonymphae]